MGEVWSAHDDVLDRTVAVKIIRPHLADDEYIRARLQLEARLAGSLNHPGIVDVFDYGEDEIDGRTVPFLVMPYIDGAPLSQVLRERHTLPVGETMAVVADVADALQAAHAAGIVHRDLKPANILLTSTGRVMLVDFGIARSLDSESLTQTGTLIGTADYLSPEQSSGRSATHISDLYALGVVAYACLAGAPPFHRDSDIATALAHIQAPLPELPPEVSSTGAGMLIASLLAKEPSDRPQTASEVAVVARSYATALPSEVRAQTVTTSADSPVVFEATEPAGTVPGTAPLPAVPLVERTPLAGVVATDLAIRERRRPRRVVMLSSALVFVAIVIALLFAGGGNQVQVPDVRGMTTAEATAKLKDEGLKIATTTADLAHHKAGEVARQSPAPGDRVDKGSVIKVTVATGRIAIPHNLVGMSYGDASAVLGKLGLRASQVDAVSTAAAGTVVMVSPDTTARPGDLILLAVSTGPSDSSKPGKSKPHNSPGKSKATPKKPKGKVTPSPAPTTASPSPSDTATSAGP
ncbi:MAG: serine/threonine protein kinase [Aeromicrobium sp.]|nr:serine/threonine protein kinase [Aeromicrobium sp.]